MRKAAATRQESRELKTIAVSIPSHRIVQSTLSFKSFMCYNVSFEFHG